MWVALATLAIGAAVATSAQASPATPSLEPQALAGAETIRAQVDARYRRLRPGLAVTEASSAGVVESFTLLTPDLLEARSVGAGNGIYYASCPVGATCPYPVRRFARPAADLVPRRLALELAVRSFLETSADVVAVSLPTRRFVLFVVEREELAQAVDMPALARALSGQSARALSASLERLVDRFTRSRMFLFVALEPGPNGVAWAGVPLWPTGAR
jgi:hypothetical protein